MCPELCCRCVGECEPFKSGHPVRDPHRCHSRKYRRQSRPCSFPQRPFERPSLKPSGRSQAAPDQPLIETCQNWTPTIPQPMAVTPELRKRSCANMMECNRKARNRQMLGRPVGARTRKVTEHYTTTPNTQIASKTKPTVAYTSCCRPPPNIDLCATQPTCNGRSKDSMCAGASCRHPQRHRFPVLFHEGTDYEHEKETQPQEFCCRPALGQNAKRRPIQQTSFYAVRDIGHEPAASVGKVRRRRGPPSTYRRATG